VKPTFRKKAPRRASLSALMPGYSGGTAPYCNEADQSMGRILSASDVRVDGTLVLQFPTLTLNW
jgi:hypothetical protein